MKAHKAGSEESNEAKTWNFPEVDAALNFDETKTNAINKPMTWKYEPPEEEEEDLTPLTAEDIEAIRKAAYDEGFDLGYKEAFEKGMQEGHAEGLQKGIEEGTEQGIEQGKAHGQAEITAHIQQFETILTACKQPLATIDKNVENELVVLAVKLAESVIGREVTLQKEIILQAISEGIKVLPISDAKYQIHLHPSDYALVNQHFGAEVLQENAWHLIESDNVAQGGCEISTSNNAVDMSIERRCRDVLDQFLLQQGLSNDISTD